jgi:preprotein translocase subunit YajC
MSLFIRSVVGVDLGSLGVPKAFLVAMAAPAQGGNPLISLIPFVLVLAIFYFVMVLPMRRRQQKVQAFLDALKVGDKVVTSGGILGSITRITDQVVQLQIADKVRIDISRAAVVGYQGQEPVAPATTGSVLGSE